MCPILAQRPTPVQIMTRARLWSVITALIGVSLFTLTIAWFGWAGVVRALSAVRVSDFIAYLGVQAVIVAGLAVAWRMVLRSRRGGRFLLLYWGRLVRDAAGEFLPFSHVGGFILGGRAIALGGVAFADAAASTLARRGHQARQIRQLPRRAIQPQMARIDLAGERAGEPRAELC